MKLTVNLAEDAIITLKGKAGRKLVIQDCERYPLPQGVLINDVVTDEEQFLQVLQTIKARYGLCASRVHLVLGSNQIVTKVMQVPKMTEKQMSYLVKMELEHYRTEEKEMIYDYSIIREGDDENGATVLGAAIERGRTELYEELFARCGIKIVSVDIALNALLHLVECIPQLEGGTYLLSVLDGRNMMTVLYIDGIYRHTARSRFLHERGSTELLREAVKEIAAMASFAKSLENGTEVRTLYVGGMNREEQSTLFDMLGSELGIMGGPVKEDGLFITKRKPEFCLADYVYAAGSLLGRQV